MLKHTNWFIFFFMGIVLTGCSDKSVTLARTWKVQDLKYSKEIPADMKPAIENSINQMKNSFRLTYKVDGTYESKMGEQILQGKWKLNWNSSKLSVTTSGGDAKEYQVMLLNENDFSFKANEGGEEVVFVMVADK